MKKLFILLFVMGISISSFAGLKSKKVIGDWKYTITLYDSQMEGTFMFSRKNRELEGEAIDSEKNIFPISKIKIDKKNNTLFFVLPRETDVEIEFIITVNDNKFTGKGWINDTSFKIKGEKLILND